MGVRDVHHHGAARQAVAADDFGGDAVGGLARDAALVEREQHAAVAGGVGDGERLGPELLRGAFGGFVARRVAGHPEAGGGGDILAGGAGAPGGGRGGGKRGKYDGEQRREDGGRAAE
ncbi:MAG: hypothetical protein RLZZ221_2864, partial [Verrucomicrobiota bacterium]